LHDDLTGHALHFGDLALHTSAPNSISAWLCVHVNLPVRGNNRSAISQSALLPTPVFGFTFGANTRCNTRATLVSTSEARRSYANDATAPAV
jgi:hypothetical protein